jgi:hypothetical protein
MRSGCVLVLAGVLVPASARAQRTLDEAAQRARYAWMMHDAGMLVSSRDTLALRLPGGEDVVTGGASHAERLLSRYLQPSAERGFDFRTVKATGAEQGYAEAVRRYVIRGTSDVVEETVFFGFRRSGGRWHLTEIRVTP